MADPAFCRCGCFVAQSADFMVECDVAKPAFLVVGRLFGTEDRLGYGFALRHSVTTALAAAVLLLLLWLSPLLIYEPAPAADIVRWLSPFSHAALFTQGIFHVQTAVFVLLHVLFFGSCFILIQQENR